MLKIKDNDFYNRALQEFHGKTWKDINFHNIHNEFGEDTSQAYYYLIPEFGIDIFPAVIMQSLDSIINNYNCEFLLENAIFTKIGVNGTNFEIIEILDRDQLAVSLSVLTYLSVYNWSLPSKARWKHIARKILRG